MGDKSLYEFTGSGWGVWFSTRKWMLYKLGTQENLATDIKPIWGILEKWQSPRSAFSKLWIAFFLRKTSPGLNCIMLKLRNQNFWKQLPGNGSLFRKPNIQPFELFDSCNEMQRDAASVANLDRREMGLDFKQNDLPVLSRKSGTTRKSMNVLPEMLKLCS